MTRTSFSSVILLAAALASGGCASAGPVVAAQSGDVIRAGETRTGRLSAASPTLSDDSHYQDWIYQGQAGETVTIELRSSDFDAFLHLLGANGTVIDTDDDGAGGTDSRIETRLPESGRYTVRANSYADGETGSYTLSVTSHGVGAEPVQQARTIRPGESRVESFTGADARLEDDTYYHDWVLEGRDGESVRIELRSNDFDAFLTLGLETNGQFSEIAADDDGAGGTDSRIDIVLSGANRYIIRANTLFERETGEYTLSVMRR